MSEAKNPIKSLSSIFAGFRDMKKYSFTSADIDVMKNYLTSAEKNVSNLTNEQFRYLKVLEQQSSSTDDAINSLNGMTKASKLSSVAISALNTAATALAITIAATLVDAIVNYNKRLAEQTKSAVDAFKAEQDSIQQTADRIKELYDSINSGELTLDEHIEANKELLGIQNDMIKNYGSQVEGIDLVTSSIEQQTEAIEKYKAAANRAAYFDMQNEINQNTESQSKLNWLFAGLNLLSLPVNPGALGTYLNISGQSGSYNPSEWKLAQGVFGSNADNALEKFEKGEFSIPITIDPKANKVIEQIRNINRDGDQFIISGNMNEVLESINTIRSMYPDLINENEAYKRSLDSVEAEVRQIQSDYGGYYDVVMENSVTENSQYSKLRDNLSKAYDAYAEALVPGATGEVNEERLDNAIERYKQAVLDITNTIEDSNIRQYILDQFSGPFDEASANVENDINKIKNAVEEADTELSRRDVINLLRQYGKGGNVNLFKRPEVRLEDYNRDNQAWLKEYGLQEGEYATLLTRTFTNGKEKNEDTLSETVAVNFTPIYTDATGTHVMPPDDFQEYCENVIVGIQEDVKGLQIGVEFTGEDAIKKAKEAAQRIHELQDIFYDDDFKKARKEIGVVESEEASEIDIAWSTLLESIEQNHLNALDLLQRSEGELYDILAELAAYYTEGDIGKLINLLVNMGQINSGKTKAAVSGITRGNFDQYYLEHWYGMDDKIKAVSEELENTWTDEELNFLTLQEFKDFLEIPPNTMPTVEAFNKAKEAYLNYVETVEDNPVRIAADAVDSLAEAESAINSLSDLYWEVVKKAPNASTEDLEGWGFADPAKINAVEQAFTKLAEKEDEVTKEKLSLALKDFEEVLVRFPNDSEKAEKAMNDLITTYINESSILDDLTEENKEYMVARLKVIGVDNAEEVVQSRLTKVTKATTKAIKDLRKEYDNYYEDLNNKDVNPDKYADAIKALIPNLQEVFRLKDADGNPLEQVFSISPEFVTKHIDTIKKMMDGDKEAFAELQKEVAKEEFKIRLHMTLPDEAVDSYFEEIWDLIDETNLKDIEIGASIDDAAFIAALNAMVKNSWTYAEQMAEAFKAWGFDLQIGRQFGKTGGNGITSEAAAAMDAAGPIRGITKIGENGFGESAKYKAKTPEDKGGGGSKDTEKTQFEKELEILDKLRDNDVIDLKHYLDQKRLLIEKFYKNGLLSAEEYFEKLHAWLREMLELYNSVISDVTKILQKQIDSLEKERDKKIKEIEKARDAEIKSIDDQIEAIDKKIKKKNEEIEAMEKEHETRKQNMDLMRAEYELQRSLHQRVNLVYKEGPDGKGQMVYQADPKAIKDAQEEVDEQRYQKQLKILQDELEIYEKQKESLEEKKQDIEEYYQKMIDETNEYYDNAIQKIQDYIDLWTELSEVEERLLMEDRLASLGLSMDDILNLDMGSFEVFKSGYLGLLEDIYSRNEGMNDLINENFGEVSGYLADTQEAMEGLAGINLESLTTALDTVDRDTQSIADCAGPLKDNLSDSFMWADVSLAPLKDSLDEVKSTLTEISNTKYTVGVTVTVDDSQLSKLKGINGTVDFSSGSPDVSGAGNYKGTVGAAFFDGYPGLTKDEQDAIRSEFGQPELTVYPNGTYEITTTPTISDLPKGTVIFNEEQTKRILKNNGKGGKAFATGTTSSISPLKDAMPEKFAMMEQLQNALKDNLDKMTYDIAGISSNVRNIATNITNVRNDSGNTMTINGGINVTCPGVTEAEVAKNIGGALREQLNGMFTGFALKADQLAMRR